MPPRSPRHPRRPGFLADLCEKIIATRLGRAWLFTFIALSFLQGILAMISFALRFKVDQHRPGLNTSSINIIPVVDDSGPSFPAVYYQANEAGFVKSSSYVLELSSPFDYVQFLQMLDLHCQSVSESIPEGDEATPFCAWFRPLYNTDYQLRKIADNGSAPKVDDIWDALCSWNKQELGDMLGEMSRMLESDMVDLVYSFQFFFRHHVCTDGKRASIPPVDKINFHQFQLGRAWCPSTDPEREKKLFKLIYKYMAEVRKNADGVERGCGNIH